MDYENHMTALGPSFINWALKIYFLKKRKNLNSIPSCIYSGDPVVSNYLVLSMSSVFKFHYDFSKSIFWAFKNFMWLAFAMYLNNCHLKITI